MNKTFDSIVLGITLTGVILSAVLFTYSAQAETKVYTTADLQICFYFPGRVLGCKNTPEETDQWNSPIAQKAIMQDYFCRTFSPMCGKEIYVPQTPVQSYKHLMKKPVVKKVIKKKSVSPAEQYGK